jgi:hypothetical protein
LTETVAGCANFVLIAGLAVHGLTLFADHPARGRQGVKNLRKKHGGEASEKYLLTTSASIHAGSVESNGWDTGRALARRRLVCYNSEAGYGARGAGAARVAFGCFRDFDFLWTDQPANLTLQRAVSIDSNLQTD